MGLSTGVVGVSQPLVRCGRVMRLAKKGLNGSGVVMSHNSLVLRSWSFFASFETEKKVI